MRTIIQLLPVGRLAPFVVVASILLGAPPAWAQRKAATKPAAKAAPKPAPQPEQDAFTRGTDLFQRGKLDEALVAFREAEKESPRDAIVQSWLGFVYIKKARYDEAIRYLRRSLELGPNNPDTYNNLGNAHLAKNDVDSAIEAYRQAVNLVKDRAGSHADLYYNLGNALARKNDLDEALAAFKEAARQDAADPYVLNNLGFVYERLNARDPDKYPIDMAVEHYRKASEKSPENPVFQRNLGLAARKVPGQADLALRALKKAVSLDKSDYNSHLALAEEYQNRKQTPDAIAAYQAAIALRPKEFVPRYNLGLLYARDVSPTSGVAFANATTHLNAAAALRPSDHRALSALGWVYLTAGKAKEASEFYKKAVQAAGEDRAAQQAHANLGLSLERQGDRLGAIENYRAALRIDPKDVATRRWLAALYLAMKKYEEATTEFQLVVADDPKDGVSYTNLGFALEKLGKIEEAVTAYKQAIDANPRLAVAHNNLGACYERQNQRELAKECYLRARQIDPKFEDARRNLQRLGVPDK